MPKSNTAPTLEDYIPIVGESTIDELKLLASHLKGKKIQHINSTKVGGGVAEMLNRIVPLMKELGVDIEWDTIEGNPEFFNVTKKFHNALHGRSEILVDRDFDIYLETAREYNQNTKIKGDVVFVHDPQPIALIQNKKKFKNTKWAWRCHIDVSSPNERVWDFLSTFVEGYDGSIFSSPKFTRPLKIPQFLICPAIDPLSDKNKPLGKQDIDKTLAKYGINKNKPIITQVSRYDYLKDPLGLVEAFKLVKKYVDAQLVFVGNSAADDPEGAKVLNEVKEKAEGLDDVHILLIPPERNDVEVNALQRASSVVVQKSIKEGFALTVTEALWKGKPVVASAVGGIPLQIKNKYSGLLSHSIEGTALHIRQFLHNPAYAKRLSHNGKTHIKRNFLITRLIREHMLLVLALFNKGDIISL
ncbi:MAG: glycosyltransferase [Candidatus Omnitrophica bacterium]|nr:glycosyltransferase [Candidatus Omnitrophota bacterium]